MVIFNQNKMKPTLLLSLILLTLAGCEIDNYEAPDLTITGKVVDYETGELVESGGINSGTIVRLYEGNSQQPLIYNTYPEGHFINSKVFAGVYTIEAEGPFTLHEGKLENQTIKGGEEIVIEVIPNVRLSINIDGQSGVTARISLSYEKVAAEQEMIDIGLVWSEFPNPNVYTFAGGSIIQEAVESSEPATGTKTFTLENLKSNTTYYVRGTARTANPGNYYNYSPQVVLQTR